LNTQEIAAAIKSLFDRNASTYNVLRVAAHFRRLELEAHLHQKMNGKICDGPFAGVKCLPSAYASTLAPKLLGTYEKELQQLLLGLALKVDCFLDVGCAEGYYTSCIAVATPIKSIVGVDISAEALELAQKSALLNNVLDKCYFTSDLADAIGRVKGSALVMIDVDGAEISVVKNIFSSAPAALVNGFIFVVETDYDRGRSNKDQIISLFGEHGFACDSVVNQILHYRLPSAASTLSNSLLDQIIYGLEGRPLDQSWLVFSAAERCAAN
jgi:SAM-dependent methyltransferase